MRVVVTRRNGTGRTAGCPTPGSRLATQVCQLRRRQSTGARISQESSAGWQLARGQGLRRAVPVSSRRHLSSGGEPFPERAGADRRLRQQRAERSTTSCRRRAISGRAPRLRLERDGDRPADRRDSSDAQIPFDETERYPSPNAYAPSKYISEVIADSVAVRYPHTAWGWAAHQQRHRSRRLRPVSGRVGRPKPQQGQLLELHRRPRRRHCLPGGAGRNEQRSRGVPDCGGRYPGEAGAARLDG